MQSTHSSPSTGFLLFAGLALLLSPLAAESQVTQPLTAEQVSCSADQLRSILGRSAIFFGPGYDERRAAFLFTYAGGSNELSGLALMEQEDDTGHIAGPERQLFFSVIPSRTKLRRIPSKPQLNTLYLLRDGQNTDPSRLEDAFAMAVVVDPTLDPQKNDDFSSLLAIDNLGPQDGGLTSDSKAGRGLQAILDRCRTTSFTRADLHVFNVLARTVRVTAWSTRRTDKKAERLHKLMTIYRGEEATPISGGVRTSYRIDVYPLYGETTPRVSLELAVDLAEDGTLGDATLRVLPACAAGTDRGCTSATSEVSVSVIQPIYGKKTWTAEPSSTICWKGPAGCPGEASFSFAERLQGTTWLKP